MSECSFIELASGSVRAGVIQGHGKKARLTVYHEEKIMVSDEDVPKVLTSVIEGIASRMKLSGKSVVVGVSSKYLIYRAADFPFADKKRVAKTLPFQIEENLPVPIDEVVVDAFEISSNATSSKWFACCIEKKLMTAIIEACHNSKIEPISVSPSFAGIPAILPDKEMSLVIDLGSETTDLLIVQDKKVRFCRTLRLAGKTITASLADALSVSQEVAEDTKLASKGFEDSDAAFKDILNAEARRLVREIKMTLSTIPEELAPKNIFILGGGSKFNGFAEYLKGKLNAEVTLLDNEAAFKDIASLDKPDTSGLLPPSGLAAMVNSNVVPCVNFRKDEYAYHGVFDSIAWSLLILLILVSGVLGVFGYHFYGVHAKHKQQLDKAGDSIANMWEKVMPDHAKIPNDYKKFPPFIDKYRTELLESEEIKSRYYITSVLKDITNVRDYFRRAKLTFETVSMEASKSNLKLIIMVDPEKSSSVNEALNSARNDYRVDVQSETKKDAKRYTISFSKKERR